MQNWMWDSNTLKHAIVKLTPADSDTASHQHQTHDQAAIKADGSTA